MTRTLRATLAAAAVLLSGAAQAADKVTIQIDGAAVPYYAPLYVAVANGQFARHGLDVQFVYANAADIVKNVAAGNVEFGFPNGDAVVAARANGVPVKVIHTTYQRGIGAVLFKKSSGITGPASLKGRNLAVTSYGSPNYIQLQVMLKSAGLGLDDVHVEIVGTGAITDALKGGQVDAIVFSELRAYTLKADGVDVGVIRADDYLPSHGNVVVAGEGWLAGHRAQAKAFDQALDEALAWIIAGHAAEAVALSVDKFAPTMKGQEALVTQVLNDVFIPTVWQGPATAQNGLGYGDLASWQKTIDVQADYHVIPQAFKAGDLVIQPGQL